MEVRDQIADSLAAPTAAKKGSTAYREWLKQDLGRLIDNLDDLTEVQKHALRSRWLDRVLYAEKRSSDARVRYYGLRLTTIVGAVVVPALVSLNLRGGTSSAIRWSAFGISLAMAVSAAVEEFFHYGERWRHYRRSAEWLKIEGWQFLQLSGRYRRARNHAAAFPAFAERVEGAIHRDVQEYVTEIAMERAADDAQQARAKPPITPTQPFGG